MRRRRPRLLDLFCGAGGAGMGYHRAGFDVVGVDLEPQPDYPFEFHQADAMTFSLDGFEAVHASPPCQAFSVASKAWPGRIHKDLLSPIRRRLLASGKAYVIENVPGAPMVDAIQLCGSSFGLSVRRHRLFECSAGVMAPPCAHHLQQKRRYPPTRSDRTAQARVVSVFGAGGGPAKNAGLWAEAMGIDWMDKRGLAQAIPPAYTEHIGEYLFAALCFDKAA